MARGDAVHSGAPPSLSPQDIDLEEAALADRTETERRRALAATVDGIAKRQERVLGPLRQRHAAAWLAASDTAPSERVPVAAAQLTEVDEAHASIAADDAADFDALADATAATMARVSGAPASFPFLSHVHNACAPPPPSRLPMRPRHCTRERRRTSLRW